MDLFFYPSFFFILALSTPYAFLIGLILPYSLGVIQEKRGQFTTGALYITDNIGDIIGGISFSFILVYLLSPFEIIAVTSSLLILVSLMLIVYEKKYGLLLISILPVTLFFGFALENEFEVSTL